LSENDDNALEEGMCLSWMFSNLTQGKDERVFLLDKSLHFRSTLMDGKVVLVWRDLSGDPGEMYEFVCDSATSDSTSHTFELVGTFCFPPTFHSVSQLA
jgi:hypothetical protein